MIEVAVACTTTATDWISRVTTCVKTTATTMAMIALGSGSPVGLMIVVSPVDRNENGMLTTCAIAPKTNEMITITPSAGQNRPRMSVQERAIAPRIVACSRMMAAGASRSFVDSHSVSGSADEHDQDGHAHGDGKCGEPDSDDRRRHDGDQHQHGEGQQQGVADQTPRHGLDPLPERTQGQLLGHGGMRHFAHDDALHDDAQGSGRESQHDRRRSMSARSNRP